MHICGYGEMAAAADLESVVLGRGGSSPSTRTSLLSGVRMVRPLGLDPGRPRSLLGHLTSLMPG